MARSLDIATELLDARSKEDIGRVFEAVSRTRVDGLLVGIDAVTQEHRKLIGDLARQQRVPTLCASREYVEADGLLKVVNGLFQPIRPAQDKSEIIMHLGRVRVEAGGFSKMFDRLVQLALVPQDNPEVGVSQR